MTEEARFPASYREPTRLPIKPSSPSTVSRSTWSDTAPAGKAETFGASFREKYPTPQPVSTWAETLTTTEILAVDPGRYAQPTLNVSQLLAQSALLPDAAFAQAMCSEPSGLCAGLSEPIVLNSS